MPGLNLATDNSHVLVQSFPMKHLQLDHFPELIIIGGGLAGCEAAWQAAQRQIHVHLYEMRPTHTTSAHTTGDLAEIICSNSFGSLLPDRASGLLKQELYDLGSLLLEIANACALPAGGALAVDRHSFSGQVTQRIENHPNITVHREEVTAITDQPTIIASGPLTSTALALAIQSFTGLDHLFFFDAVAPVVEVDSIDMTIAYRASRYGKGQSEDGDYINCPMTREEYDAFITALTSAERIPLREFENQIQSGVRAGLSHFFEGCLPVEIMAQRSHEALGFGPLRPVGLRHPVTQAHSYAVVQLRQDNLAGNLYNLVGFQTNLTYTEQQRVFRMIPGLAKAEFARYGQMHRNTFIASPLLLRTTLQARARENLFFAGQITGIEGYMGNIASGWLAGVNAARFLHGQDPLTFPQTTLMGGLCHYITHAEMKDFQPMKAIFGILPPLENQVLGKRMRAAHFKTRARRDFEAYLEQQPTIFPTIRP